MVGIRFGNTNWEDLPQQLGLSVDAKHRMVGMWRGVPVCVSFMWYEQPSGGFAKRDYRPDIPCTAIHATIDPPLGIEGLDHDYYFDHIVDYPFRADLKARAQMCAFFNTFIGDDAIGCSVRGRFEANAAVYGATFDLLVWGAQILQGRRSQMPPPWELAVAEEWPALAKDWGMQLDRRRGEMSGVVQGRPTRAFVVNSRGMLLTRVEVATPLPPGGVLTVSRRVTNPGLVESLFSSMSATGSEIKFHDHAFDSAFVVKGSEPFARRILTPAVRHHVVGLAQAGAQIGFDHDKLTVTARRFLCNRDELDPLLKATFAAASAMGAPALPSLPPTPYR